MDPAFIEAIDSALTCADAAHLPEASASLVARTAACVRRCWRPCALRAALVNTAACCAHCVDECTAAERAPPPARLADVTHMAAAAAALATVALLVYWARCGARVRSDAQRRWRAATSGGVHASID